MNKSPETLFELLDKYSVEVPIIQRDYAQGRKNIHVKKIRKNLLRDIKKAVVEKETPVNLNFIYGKISDNHFIPIDGQQRLTTLLLLHIYAFSKDNSKTELLKKFTYSTRRSSRTFLEKVVENRSTIFSSQLKPSEEIGESEWFIPNWIYDPTIESMMVMFDAIKDTFEDRESLAFELENNKSVVFEFLETTSLGNEDSLYIKLNARGKELSLFENFKSQYIERIKSLEEIQEIEEKFFTEYKDYFDGKWADYFWEKAKKVGKDQAIEKFNDLYLRFFGVLFMNKEICQKDTDWSDSIGYKKIDKETLKVAYEVLNFLCEPQNNKDYQEAHSIIESALRENRTYKNLVLFHAITSYISNNKAVNKASFFQWVRIIKNLTLNTQVDSEATYRRAIGGINEIMNYKESLLEHFAKKGKISGFSQDQIKEEQTKAEIIQKDSAFANAIYEAEQHKYFSGQIRSALYRSMDNGVADVEKFSRYWGIITELFNDSGSKHGNLLRQALLTFGDYTLPVGPYKTLCVDDPNEGASTPSLKRLFSNCDKDEIVKQFLDTLVSEKNASVEKQLEGYVARFTVPKNDWRYCFISFPQLFDRMKFLRLRHFSDDDIMLLIPGVSSSGSNYNLFLEALKEKLLSNDIELEGDMERGTSSSQWLTIEDICYIYFKKGQFEFHEYENWKEIFHETKSEDPIEEAYNYIKNIFFSDI